MEKYMKKNPDISKEQNLNLLHQVLLKKITLNRALKHEKLPVKAVKEVTLNGTIKHEKLPIKAIISGLR
jgi:hypothetical protein